MAYAGKQSSQLIMSKPLEPRIAVRLGPALPYTTQPCRPRCSLAQRRDGDLIVDSSYRGRRDGKARLEMASGRPPSHSPATRLAGRSALELLPPAEPLCGRGNAREGRTVPR